MDFSSKKVLITGASSGIGKELAKNFHSRGAALILVARRRALLEQITGEFNAIRPASASYIECDLTDQESLVELSAIFDKQKVDILITNAGRGSFGYFHELDIDEECDLIKLNVHSSLFLTHAFISKLVSTTDPRNEERKGIINLSSVAGFQPLPFMSTYAATKAFNLFHSYALSYELEDYGISSLTVCPGPVETEFFGVARVEGTMTGGTRDSASQVAADIVNAFIQGKRLVFPGRKGFWISIFQRISPLVISTLLMKKFLYPALKQSKKTSGSSPAV